MKRQISDCQFSNLIHSRFNADVQYFSCNSANFILECEHYTSTQCQLAVLRSFQKSPSGTRTFHENLNNLQFFKTRNWLYRLGEIWFVSMRRLS